MKKKPRELFRLAKQALLNAGAHEAMADTAAQHLLHAKQQGLPTHGMSRIPFYCSMLRNGRADGAARPVIATEKAAVCLIDNANGLPYVSCALAIAEVIERARRSGIGFVGIKNSAHVGVLGIHLPIVIPCHRIVAADGIGGFAHATNGYLIEAKRWLLLHEAQTDAFALRP